MITIIAAVTNDFGLGRKGDLLFHVSDDMKHFKSLTMGHPIVMGRKTFESFPKGALPGRRNLIVTRQSDYFASGAEVFLTVEDAIVAAGGDCFVIGGGDIYRQVLPIATRIEFTHFEVDSPSDTDTWFGGFDANQWKLVARSETVVDPRSGIPFHFATYQRI
ncbi:MAG: dihydrofolate reductase [Clostridiales bacterium]|nr:dihydrofolate reductase [Clostridiales bacterium]